MPFKYIKPNKKNRLKNPFVIQEGKFDEGKINSAYRDGWAEDVFMSDTKERETIGRNFDFAKITLSAIVLGFLILSLFVRTAWLQIVKGDYYSEMAEGNRVRSQRIEAKRGVIYDRNMEPLVMNEARFLLYFVPIDLPEEEELGQMIDRIAFFLKDSESEELKAKAYEVDKYSYEAYSPLLVEDNIDYETAMKLYVESANWPGVILSTKTGREYIGVGDEFYLKEEEVPQKYLSLSHILGYTGKINTEELESSGDEYLMIDYIGKTGMEKFWENELKGIGGKKRVEVDAFGKEKKILSQTDAIDGNNLLLSLDVKQQQKMEEILKEHLEKLGLNKASAVVMDPSNGEILSLVSLPSYNNNLFAEGISTKEYSDLLEHPDKPLFNRAISGEFPSGSTFKLVMLAAALEERVVSEDTYILSNGGLRISQWFFPDWRAGGHGRTDARKAIADSVNTYFYTIGGGYEDFAGLGLDRIIHYGKMFGLSSQTGIDTSGEADGFLPSHEWKRETTGENWYIGDTYHLSIGQGFLLVTPLQVALFTGVIANGGDLYRPHFVTKILNSEDGVDRVVENEAVRSGFIDDYNIMVVRQGMKMAVTHGSARRLSSLPVEAAGKTGTAQWSSKHKNHAWFTGFAPYDNPEIVVTILIEEGDEGSTAAVPVAEEYMEWYFTEYK